MHRSGAGALLVCRHKVMLNEPGALRAPGFHRQPALGYSLRPSHDTDPTMIRSILFCALLALPMSVLASSFAGTSAGSATGASSNSSGSSSGDDKVLLDAREDAAGFVASDGAIRGAWLEAALIQLRERDASARDASDMALARKILAL